MSGPDGFGWYTSSLGASQTKPFSSLAANATEQRATAPSNDAQRYWCICFPRTRATARASFQATILRESQLALLDHAGDGHAVAHSGGALERRRADDPVDDGRLRAVPGDSLPADVERHDLDELQHRARRRPRHLVDL